MERSAMLNVLTMVKRGEITVNKGAEMIELIEKGEMFTKKVKKHTTDFQKNNTYVSPMYTGYLVEYFSVPKNI